MTESAETIANLLPHDLTIGDVVWPPLYKGGLRAESECEDLGTKVFVGPDGKNVKIECTGPPKYTGKLVPDIDLTKFDNIAVSDICYSVIKDYKLFSGGIYGPNTQPKYAKRNEKGQVIGSTKLIEFVPNPKRKRE